MKKSGPWDNPKGSLKNSNLLNTVACVTEGNKELAFCNQYKIRIVVGSPWGCVFDDYNKACPLGICSCR